MLSLACRNLAYYNLAAYYAGCAVGCAAVSMLRGERYHRVNADLTVMFDSLL